MTHYTGGFLIESNAAFIHPQFNPNNLTNNVALIQLPHRPIQPSIQGINLAILGIDQPNARLVTVTGYGLTRSNNTSPVLQFAYGQILPNNNDECARSRNVTSVNSNFLCASVFRQPRICAGDTGSPVVVQHNRQLHVIGIGSHNPNDPECRHSTTLYVRVTSVLSWINEVIRPSRP